MIRAANPGDASALAAILGGWVAETRWMPKLHAPAEDLRFVQGLIASHTTRIITDSTNQPLGFLARKGEDIDALYLAASARGQGFGSRLIEEAKALARLTLWTFQANAGARAFYTRHGFTEIARGNGSGNAEGLPDLHLIWTRPLQGLRPHE